MTRTRKDVCTEVIVINTTAIVRTIDGVGRLVIPMEVRRRLGISKTDFFNLCVDGDKLILQRYEQACVFCGGTDRVEDFQGKKICARCIQELRGMTRTSTATPGNQEPKGSTTA